MNRIVKRQGALPAWIELQNNLDAAINAFRNTLLTTYTTHLVRTIISTNTLNPLPPAHSIPDHDEAWEAREFKFHEENIKQINDLTRRMNAQAPNVARRPLLTRDIELSRVRGQRLKDSVWAEVQRRSAEVRVQSTNSAPSGAIFWEGDGFASLRNATRRSLSTIARPLTAVMGRGGGQRNSFTQEQGEEAGSSRNADGPKPLRIAFVVGLGVAGIVYLRQPVRTESLDFAPPPPVKEETPVVEKAGPLGPIGLVQYYIIEPIFTFLRFFHLVILFGPVILTSPMILIGGSDRRRKRDRPSGEEAEAWGAVWWYGFLVNQMERAGPSFIKLGQWAASRADLFPASLCDKMSKLHSNGAPHSIRHTRRVIEAAFDLQFDQIFEHFEEKPIGCGAIAQVYRATLKPEAMGGDRDTSTSVAIKVLHPRVRKTVRRDIAIMSIFANIINLFPGMSWLSLPEEVSVFGEMMNSQLDLRVEAANLDRFERNFKGRGHQVTYPRPIKLGGDREESRDVLMEEFEDALPLKYFLRNGGGPYDDRIANIGLDAFLVSTLIADVEQADDQLMLLLDNWTHGDLHPYVLLPG
jgi:aarF domain-containing kinase